MAYNFEDFHAGQPIDCGACIVTEEEILEYARRYDPQPFHVDRDAAKATRWGGVIASGFHTCSIAMRMVVEHVLRGAESIGSPGLEYVRWPSPVRGDDRLHLRLQVLEARTSRSGRVGVVRWRWQMRNQREQLVLETVATSLFALDAGVARADGAATKQAALGDAAAHASGAVPACGE